MKSHCDDVLTFESVATWCSLHSAHFAHHGKVSAFSPSSTGAFIVNLNLYCCLFQVSSLIYCDKVTPQYMVLTNDVNRLSKVDQMNLPSEISLSLRSIWLTRYFRLHLHGL